MPHMHVNGFQRVFLVLLSEFMVGMTMMVLVCRGVFGKISSGSNYAGILIFDDSWGNGRGYIWKLVIDVFKSQSIWHKLIGIGPDCLEYAIYDYLGSRTNYFGEIAITSAHNEVLNYLVTVGIIGCVIYVAIIAYSIITYIRLEDNNKYFFVIALCVCSYFVHNIFCYTQIMATPFLYILLGIGRGVERNVLRDCL